MKQAIEKLEELGTRTCVGMTDRGGTIRWLDLKEILLADLAWKESVEQRINNVHRLTVNGSSLGWMLDQTRKQENRIAELEKRTHEHVWDKECASYKVKPSVPEKQTITISRTDAEIFVKTYKTLGIGRSTNRMWDVCRKALKGQGE